MFLRIKNSCMSGIGKKIKEKVLLPKILQWAQSNKFIGYVLKDINSKRVLTIEAKEMGAQFVRDEK